MRRKSLVLFSGTSYNLKAIHNQRHEHLFDLTGVVFGYKLQFESNSQPPDEHGVLYPGVVFGYKLQFESNSQPLRSSWANL